jgi:hypothetical protein
MQSVPKRLERLEKTLSSRRVPNLCSEIIIKATRTLSKEERTLILYVLQDNVDGKRRRELTQEESAAFAARNRAVQLECQSAGFGSFAEFKRWEKRQRRLRPQRIAIVSTFR